MSYFYFFNKKLSQKNKLRHFLSLPADGKEYISPSVSPMNTLAMERNDQQMM